MDDYKPKFYICLSILLVLILIIIIAIVILAYKDAYCLGKTCLDICTYLEGMFKRQLEKTCDPTCIADKVEPNVKPTVAKIKENSSPDIAQLYYYHDAITSIEKLEALGLVIKARYWYSCNNMLKDPPSVVIFDDPTTTTRFVIWRGTYTEAEVDLDMEISQVPLEGFGDVHKGFAALYTEIWLNAGLRENFIENTDQDIIIFGHSLGGAMTNLCTVNISSIRETADNFVGVASAAPRLFSPATAYDIMSNTRINLYSLQNQADVIPQIPLAVMDLGDLGVFYYQQLTNNPLREFNVIGKTLADCHTTRFYQAAVLQDIPNVISLSSW
jgi:predicted lipase